MQYLPGVSSGVKRPGCETEARSVLRLLVTANVVPSALTLFTLMMEAIHSSETSVLTRAAQRHISEDGILLNHRPENSNLT
jgi:hypothetical protein